MAKVLCLSFLLANGDCEVGASLTLGYLEHHTRLSLGILLNPLLYQRTGKARTLNRAYIICIMFLCQDVAKSQR